MSLVTSRPALVVLVISAALACLSGCAQVRAPFPSTTESASPSAAATGASATPRPSASGEDVGTPITIACDALVTPQAMYDFNPNFGSNASYTPTAGTAAATIVGYHGKSCGWVNQTSSDLITVSVADLPAPKLAEIETALQSTSSATSAFGSPGYFTVKNGVGIADIFTGSYWLSVSSIEFVGAADAQPIASDALGALAH